MPGVWGPYYSGMVPDFWLNEGGQSAAGAAIDHLLKSHPGHAEISAAAKKDGLDIIDFLEKRIIARAGDASKAALLARDIHVLPEFIGNRSPYADPDTRAVVAGLDLVREQILVAHHDERDAIDEGPVFVRPAGEQIKSRPEKCL